MKLSKKVIVNTLMMTAGLALLAACSAAPSSSAGSGTAIDKTIKIGYDLELSGGISAYGNFVKKGADLATEEINKSGGIDGKQIVLSTKDNKSDNAEAATIASNLISNNKVNVVFGPAASGGAMSVLPTVSKSAVPVLSPTATADNYTVTKGKVNSYAFRNAFQDSFQGKVLASYADNTLKSKKVVIYYDNSSDYAKGVEAAFEKNYSGTVVDKLTFASGDTDFQAALSKIKSESFDTIIMPGYYAETGLITKQARALGITAPILSGDGSSDPTFVQLAGNAAATNFYYVSGYSPDVALSSKTADFVKAYKAKYNEEPNMFSALAYDGIYYIKQAEENSHAKTSKDLAAALAKVKSFTGVTGEMTIDSNHNPVKSAIMVKLDNGAVASTTVVKP
ncbi:MAG: ABC transporter substrate-binding protein [Streptococcaceae bacterium]|jgi:branched-chain amino acid transport system substrate-binding protein|nr:ABC transporter substrate-binding protein [Streptococcaceae bacterium]